MDGRLQSSVMVGALQRLAEKEGGFAAVLAKGDSRAGAILVILAEKGRKLRMLERSLLPGGSYAWGEVGSQAIEDEEKHRTFIERRRRVDPDLWIIELDIASAERFAAEMNLTL